MNNCCLKKICVVLVYIFENEQGGLRISEAPCPERRTEYKAKKLKTKGAVLFPTLKYLHRLCGATNSPLLSD